MVPPHSLPLDKIALRRQMRAARLAFSDGLDDGAREALYARLIANVLDNLPRTLPASPVIGSYVAMPGEIDPLPVALALRERGGRLAYPLVVGKEAPLSFHLIDDPSQLQAGFARIPEPPRSAPTADPDLLLMPLVAADPLGNRLGMGAGFYDRTLAALKPRRHVFTIGLAWDLQIVTHLPADPWDEPLHAIATPSRWIVPVGRAKSMR